METHINARGYTLYKLRGKTAWKHTFTQEGIQAPWESSMETHIHSRGYTSSVGVQHGNTFTQEDIQASWESSIETHIHTGYTSSVGVQHGNIHSHKRIYIIRWSKRNGGSKIIFIQNGMVCNSCFAI